MSHIEILIPYQLVLIIHRNIIGNYISTNTLFSISGFVIEQYLQRNEFKAFWWDFSSSTNSEIGRSTYLFIYSFI